MPRCLADTYALCFGLDFLLILCWWSAQKSGYVHPVSRSQTISAYIFSARNGLGKCLYNSCFVLPMNRGHEGLFKVYK